MTASLPVETVVPQVSEALARFGSAVLVAEPGAGKTTVVPWRLMNEGWLGGKRIIMLEPRRLAARTAAGRIAWHLGEAVGRTVGYRVRFDTRVSKETRIEVVTEGVLTRLLQTDPALEPYGLVILDEFHERSLHADLGLALLLQTRTVLRPDLRVLVMSATIDAKQVAAVLGGAPIIDAPGRVFPVETRYRPSRPGQRTDALVAATVREALAAELGDILVFLPGVGEIRRVETLLTDIRMPAGVRALPLHGSMPAEAQDAVLAPSPFRRVILATSVAETSLTVPGVRVVVDGGWMRVPRFSPRTGMTRLETVRVSRSSADQRRGRAGRTEPGVCYRLWSAGEEAGFLGYRTPEILASDLAALALELAAAGVRDPADLVWIDPPPAAALGQARELLALLGAVDTDGRITPLGKSMAGLAMHPRLARMALRAREEGHGALASTLAALLSDRDIARRVAPEQPPDADLRLRMEALAGRTVPGFEVDRNALHRLRADIRAWRERLGVPEEASDSDDAGTLLAWSYPDRVAARRTGQFGRFLLRNGRGASLPISQSLSRADYLVVADVDDTGAESRILLAAPVGPEVIASLVAAQGERDVVTAWNAERRTIVVTERIRLGAIVIEEHQVARPSPVLLRQALVAEIAIGGLALFDWTEGAVRVRQRLAFLHALEPERWPDVSDGGLLGRIDEWLGTAADRGSLAAVDPGTLLLNWLPHDRRAMVERLAPDRFEAPTGSRLMIDYSDPAAPALPVRLQEMFGVTVTPTIGGGRVPLTIQLLSPAGRPVQVTRDLAGFWRTSYFDVRKDMKGRYPKHDWPENPLDATPTRRAKPRSPQ